MKILCVSYFWINVHFNYIFISIQMGLKSATPPPQKKDINKITCIQNVVR